MTFDFTDSGARRSPASPRRSPSAGCRTRRRGVAGDVEAASQFSGHFAIVLDEEIKSRPIINFVENPNGSTGGPEPQISGIGDLRGPGPRRDPPDRRPADRPHTDLAIDGLGDPRTGGARPGLKAGIVGLIIVCFFLIAYYRFLGVVAVLGLALYGVFLFALIKLIPITLTLPGIAGLILTIGVAADSNIVIFERIKEEVMADRSARRSRPATARGSRRSSTRT